VEPLHRGEDLGRPHLDSHGGHHLPHARRACGATQNVILLTGAAGAVGRALLRRLVEGEEPVRCLVRDPRRLGAERVRVQIALGDLAEPASFRNAMRGVGTVVHLAATMRDQPKGPIEEVNGVATLRLLRAAERAGVRRFVYCSCLGASEHSTSRVLRAKALAERAVRESRLHTIVVAPSLIYAPENRWLRMLDRFSKLPALIVSGSGRARSEPIWSEDVAACLAALLGERGERLAGEERIELAGPEAMSFDDVLRTAMAGRGRARPVAHVPLRAARLAVGLAARFPGSAPVTSDEAELIEASMLSRAGTAHAEALGVRPLPISAVLGTD
jgi:uncharacterized protein YbjT (DUF2867 family)